jgi:hypothetical protein
MARVMALIIWGATNRTWVMGTWEDPALTWVMDGIGEDMDPVDVIDQTFQGGTPWSHGRCNKKALRSFTIMEGLKWKPGN